jgi:Arc/MetJ-type ribon-helix-helix transcriptional regulator
MANILQHSQPCSPVACIGFALPGPGAPLQLFSWADRYDRSMSDRKTRITVTIDPDLAVYAEQLVAAGKAPSVSAVVNDALAAGRLRDQRARRLWKEATERADQEKVARMHAHVNAQLVELPESHRYR